MNFRFKALAKLREPDELDTPAILTSPRGWIALLSLAAVMVAALAWAVFGRLSQTVSATGLITRPYDLTQVQSLYPGLVTAVDARPGGWIRAGQDLAIVQDPRGASHEVTTFFAGRVMSVSVARGQVIAAGATVATVERSAPASSQPIAMLFVSPSQAAGIAPGESVGLAVASAPPAAFGLLRGRVLAVGQLPLTAAEEALLTGGTIAAGTLAAAGKLLVTVSLRTDSRTVSGYSWTTAAGPPVALPAVVPATGTIALGEQSPITLLFGQ